MSPKALRTSIVILTLYTALIHLVVLTGVLFPAPPGVAMLFALNGFGYLVLLAALFIRWPWLQEHRTLLHMLFIGYATVTILAWVIGGTRDLLGYTTQVVQLALIIALWAHMRS
jgi:hypothetical protein